MIDLSQGGIDHERVLQALLFQDGRRDVRYEVRTLRGGVHHRTLAHSERELQCNYLSPVKYRGRFTVRDDEDVDWRSDLIQLVMSVRVDGQELFYPFPRLKPTRVRGVGTIEVEASDETVLLQCSSLGERPLIPAGTRYTQYIENGIAQAGFHSVFIEESEATVVHAREDWEPQTDRLTFFNGLLTEIGYRSIEVDREGILCSGPYIPPTRSLCHIRYEATESTSVLLSARTRDIDSYHKANRFIGYVSNPEGEPMYFEYCNEDPASPTSPARNGGYVLTAVRRFDNAADANALEVNVRRWAAESEQQYENVTIETAVMPHHEIREIVAVNCRGISGIYTEVGWTVGSTMTHRLRRILYE